MEREIYITETKYAKCKSVADAFAELYEEGDIVVLDAGRYGLEREYNKWVQEQYPLRKRAIEDKSQNNLSELEEELLLVIFWEILLRITNLLFFQYPFVIL